MTIRILGRAFGLLVVVAALAFSGCAMDDAGYTPISSGETFNSGYAPSGGFGGGPSQGSGFRSGSS